MPPFTHDVGQAVPKAFNLGTEKPTTVPAYGRQVQSIATNAQSFGPNTIANIVIDTSTPGSFLDPMQSLIEFDITFTNNNPNIDFLNFGAAGAASLIQELRIYCQGTPIVEILDYNLAFETWMKLNNSQQQEFKMYMENSWRAPVAPGESDLNFVKPPMVDLNGVIMWPTAVNMYGDVNTHAKKSIGHYLSRASNTTAAVAASAAGVAPATPAFQAITGDFYTATTGVNYNLTQGNTNYLIQLNSKEPSPGIIPQAGTAPSTVGAGDTITIASSTNPFNYSHNYNPNDINSTYTDAPGTINSMTWTNRIDNTYVTWPSTIRPEKKGANLGIRMQEQAIKNYRLEDYLMYLSNVKNIPVGISPAKSFIASTDTAINRPTARVSNETALSSWNLTPTAGLTQTNTVTTSTNQGSFTYHVAMPLFDGLLGMGAEKQFPTMLIAPGSLYIQIRFAKVEQAVQVSMDPCRRIFGTYRDYLPNIGSPRYYATEYMGEYLLPDRCSTSNNNTIEFPTTWMAYTPHAARGTDFAWSGILALFPPTVASKLFAAGPPEVDSAGHNGYRNNIYYNAYQGGNALDEAALGAGSNQLANSQGFNEGLSTGLPKPQYVPVSTPWIYNGNLFHQGVVGTNGAIPTINTYTDETSVCYGTYLPCSTPQVRRTTTSALVGSVTPTNAEKAPTFLINNLKYTGYQTVLSNEITSAIVRSAAREDVSIQGQTWKTYRTICSNSQSQTIILPIKIASANSIHCVFQNQTMYENLSYNSLTGNCPLTTFKWNVDTNVNHFVGSDTAPSLSGVTTTGTPFSIQLRLGNELLPIQPITTVSQLVSELERSLHVKGNMAHSVQAKAITQGSASTTYGCLANHDFLAPFVPIEALDDQTITDNPAFMDYTGVTNYDTFRRRGNYNTGLFIPPESDFILGFDLDTFPGNSDFARSGRYLGNAPLTLQMQGAQGLGNSALSTSASDSWACIAIVLCDIRFSIGAGGAIQAYY